MDRRDKLVRRPGDDREGPHRPAALRLLPIPPQTRHGERLAVGADNRIGLLLSSRTLLPFVKAIDRHEAAAAAKGIAESRFGGGGFGYRVDAAHADRGIFRPERDQPPTQQIERAAPLLIKPDDGQLLGRRAVVIGRAVRHGIHRLEQHPDLAERRFLDYATAHFLAPSFSASNAAVAKSLPFTRPAAARPNSS